MSVVQFDAVEAGLLGASGRCGKQFGQLCGQISDMWQVHIGDTLTVSAGQRFVFASAEHLAQFIIAQRL